VATAVGNFGVAGFWANADQAKNKHAKILRIIAPLTLKIGHSILNLNKSPTKQRHLVYGSGPDKASPSKRDNFVLKKSHLRCLLGPSKRQGPHAT
jgi:hypothetical protein